MIKTEDDLRRALRDVVADVHVSSDISRFIPSGRVRRRPRRGVVLAIPLLLVLFGSAAAAAIPALQSNSPDTTRLFIRTTRDGVDIRAYQLSGDLLPGLDGELSTNRAVGLVGGSERKISANRIRAEAVTVFGTNGNDAVAVAVRTGSGVANVRARFVGGATDTMRPVDGWAILAHHGQQSNGRIDAFNQSGRLIDSVKIPAPSNPGGPAELSKPTFVRTTRQGILIVGHTVNGFLSPDVAGPDFVMVGLEGLTSCREQPPRALSAGVNILTGLGSPIGSMGPPITLVIVHAGTATTKVMVVFANHVEDSMTPVAGQAILATLGTIADNGRLGTLERGVLEGFARNGTLITKLRLSPLGAGDYGTCT